MQNKPLTNFILPENFKVPSAEAYDEQIARLDAAMAESGGTNKFIYHVRQKRDSHDGFMRKALLPLAMCALTLEDRDANRKLVDPFHEQANGIMAGMLLGHLANEQLYPNILQVEPYRNGVYFNLHVLNDTQREAYSELNPQDEIRIERFGAKAMAGFALTYISEDSWRRLEQWEHEIILSKQTGARVRLGFGMAVYMAWDYYTDILQQQGRGKEIMHILPERVQ